MKHSQYVLVICAFALASCGKGGGETVTHTDQRTGETVTVTYGENGIKSESKSLSTEVQTGAGARSSLPVHMPAYPGSKILESSSLNMGDSKMNTASFTSGDAPQKVAAFYRDAMRKAGYAIKTDIAVPGEEELALEAKRSNGDSWKVGAGRKRGENTKIDVIAQSKT